MKQDRLKMFLKKHNLIKFSLVSFLILFFIIYLIETTYVPNKTSISEISKKDINKYVLIEGIILKQNLINQTLFLRIKDNSSEINGLIFNSDFIFDKNQTYDFEGKISLYKNEPELIIKKVTVKNQISNLKIKYKI